MLEGNATKESTKKPKRLFAGQLLRVIGGSGFCDYVEIKPRETQADALARYREENR